VGGDALAHARLARRSISARDVAGHERSACCERAPPRGYWISSVGFERRARGAWRERGPRSRLPRSRHAAGLGRRTRDVGGSLLRTGPGGAGDRAPRVSSALGSLADDMPLRGRAARCDARASAPGHRIDARFKVMRGPRRLVLAADALERCDLGSRAVAVSSPQAQLRATSWQHLTRITQGSWITRAARARTSSNGMRVRSPARIRSRTRARAVTPGG
jgi:hypothetical protein